MHAFASSRSARVGLPCLLVILSMILLPMTAGAVSVANKDLALSLLWELGANDVDYAGQRIQQVDARNRAELAQCFANVRVIAERLAENDREVQRRLPAIRHQPSLWAPMVLAAALARDYAANAPEIQSSMSYRAMKQMEILRRQSQEMLRNPQFREILRAMGMDIDALKQWADAETKGNLRTLIQMVC